MDHPDLLEEFKRFLPGASATAAAPHAPFVQQSFYQAPMDKVTVLFLPLFPAFFSPLMFVHAYVFFLMVRCKPFFF